MDKSELIKMLRKDSSEWNRFREQSNYSYIDLGSIDFERDIKKIDNYILPEYEGFDFYNCRLNSITARNSYFFNCNFDDVCLTFSDLCFSVFERCTFNKTNLAVSKIGSCEFIDCSFINSDLSYCSAEETKFIRSRIEGTNLNNMSLVKTDFSNSIIKKSSVYGISSWDLILTDTKQEDIFCSKELTLMVDNIEIAQFIYLMINNKKIRDIIDTITSKIVLILGRFTKERKEVLDMLRENLQSKGYVAVIFDFEKPKSRDITETISTIAHLSKFVIADLTDAKSLPQELQVIVPHLPSVRIQPIILSGEREYGMYEHYVNYPWVEPIIEYNDISILLTEIEKRFIK